MDQLKNFEYVLLMDDIVMDSGQIKASNKDDAEAEVKEIAAERGLYHYMIREVTADVEI